MRFGLPQHQRASAKRSKGMKIEQEIPEDQNNNFQKKEPLLFCNFLNTNHKQDKENVGRE